MTPLLIALFAMFERSSARVNRLAALVLGLGAVLSHVASILAKLNLPNRVHAVSYAYENGLVANRGEQS